MADSHVLVTGGAGFIGSHLVDALLGRGDRVTVLDRLSAGGSLANLAQHDAEPRMTFVRGDVCDASLVDRLVAEADAVVHAAAETHVDRSIDEPAGFLTTNVLGTEAVLERGASPRHAHADDLDRRGVRRRATRRAGCSTRMRRCARRARTPRARRPPTCSAPPGSRPTPRRSCWCAARTPSALARSSGWCRRSR